MNLSNPFLYYNDEDHGISKIYLYYLSSIILIVYCEFPMHMRWGKFPSLTISTELILKSVGNMLRPFFQHYGFKKSRKNKFLVLYLWVRLIWTKISAIEKTLYLGSMHNPHKWQLLILFFLSSSWSICIFWWIQLQIAHYLWISSRLHLSWHHAQQVYYNL